jgi:thiamine kinase
MDADLARADAQLIPPRLLPRIPGCESGRPPVDVRVLAGGGWLNRCLYIRTSAGRFVLRQRLSTLARPGADGPQELTCQRAAAAAGLAPAVIDAAPDASWVLMDYVEGAMWTRPDLAIPARVEALGATLAALHALAPPAIGSLDVGAIVQGQLALIRARDSGAGPALETLAASAAQLASRMAETAIAPALNHGDLSVANLLGPRPLLVDWEYAQRADPVYDVACLLAYYPEMEGQLDRLLGAAGLAAPGCRDRLATHRALFVVFNALWRRAHGEAHGDAAGLVPAPSAE